MVGIWCSLEKAFNLSVHVGIYFQNKIFGVSGAENRGMGVIVSVQFSCSVLSNSWRPQELQHARPPCPSPTPGVHPNPCPLSRWCHPQSYLLSSPSPLALNLFQHQGLFQWTGSSHQVAEVLELQLQHQCFQWLFRVNILWDWLVWSPCCPRDSQESSTAPSSKAMSNQNLNWYSACSLILHITILDLSLLLQQSCNSSL